MKKHILCFGDSNTHGYCADPEDTEGHTGRFTENERWTCLLQKALGDDYLVIEEGLSGRTTVFDDPLTESLSGLDAIYSALKSHEPIDLLIIMLGTNDTKDRFNVNAACIANGLERLAVKAEQIMAFTGDSLNILVIAPPHIGKELNEPTMGIYSHEKSTQLAAGFSEKCRQHGWSFIDAEGIAEFNRVDHMHLTAKGHRSLAEKLASVVPDIVS